MRIFLFMSKKKCNFAAKSCKGEDKHEYCRTTKCMGYPCWVQFINC